MARLLSNRAALTWLFLVGATLATFGLAESHGLRVQWAVSVVMLIALFKARMIALHYMELKHAPRRWRIAFELWVAIVPLWILGFWFASGVVVCG